MSKTLSDVDKLLWRLSVVRRLGAFTERCWKWRILCTIRSILLPFPPAPLPSLPLLSPLLFSSSFPSYFSFSFSSSTSFSSPPTIQLSQSQTDTWASNCVSTNWVSKPLSASGWDTGTAEPFSSSLRKCFLTLRQRRFSFFFFFFLAWPGFFCFFFHTKPVASPENNTKNRK